MECIRGTAPLGLCVVLFICLWYVPTSAREIKAMNLVHNDIDGDMDHVMDHDDTNLKHIKSKAHINPLKFEPKKPSKSKEAKEIQKSWGTPTTTSTTSTTTTTTPATTTTTTTEAATTTTTEATTTTTVAKSTTPEANATTAKPDDACPKSERAPTTTSNATSSTTPPTTPMAAEGTTEIDIGNVTNVTSGVDADTATPAGTEVRPTTIAALAVRTTKVPKSMSYNLFVKKLTVHIVYESLCPFSRKFIVSQLLPTYQQLRDHMHLVLLPFGNARVSKTQTVNPNFICPRGSAECRSNMIETCIIRSVRETLTAVHIIACMSRSGAPHRVARRCVEKKGLEWHLMERCVTTSGKAYMLDMARQTWQIKKTVGHVPLVVIEGEKIYTKEAQQDLIGVICSRIPLIGICARRR